MRIALVDAQVTLPQNGTTASSSSNQFIMDIMSDVDLHVPVEPLTDDAGLTGTLNELQVSLRESRKQSLTDVE